MRRSRALSDCGQWCLRESELVLAPASKKTLHWRKFDDEEERRPSAEPARYIAPDRGGGSYCAFGRGSRTNFRSLGGGRPGFDRRSEFAVGEQEWIGPWA